MDRNIRRASTVLNNGGVIIFPTDTVWGIGCLLNNEDAIKRVFQIRNRPEEKAVLAVVDSIEMAQEYLQPIPNDVSMQLMKKYWPGGLTIILPCKAEKVPSIARGGGATLGVRQTNHPLLLELIRQIKVPLIAPSANFTGEKTPVKFSDLDPKLVSLVDFVLPGESLGQQASTIIDCSMATWRVIRQGGVQIKLE